MTIIMYLQNAFKSVTLGVFRRCLDRTNDIVWLFKRPRGTLSLFLVYIFVLWLSLQQVRVAFRVVSFFRLPELLNLRAVIESNIYLVLLVTISCFVWLDLVVFRMCLAVVRSQLDKFSAKTTCKNIGTQFEPGPVLRKTPPRACKKYQKY